MCGSNPLIRFERVARLLHDGEHFAHCGPRPENGTRGRHKTDLRGGNFMGLTVMIAGLVLFLGVHTLTTQRAARARLIASIGEGGYKAFYALAALAGLALIVWGFAHYRAAGLIELWTPPRCGSS